MTWFDYGVLTVLGVSFLVGILRGFAREMIALAAWFAAFFLAAVFSDTVAGYMPENIGPMLSGLLAFLLVFIAVLVAGGVIGLVVSLMVRAAGMGLADRFLGAVFGAGRGIAVTLFAVVLAGLTPLPGESFWRQAVLAGPFETAALALRPYLPDGMALRLKYRGS